MNFINQKNIIGIFAITYNCSLGYNLCYNYKCNKKFVSKFRLDTFNRYDGLTFDDRRKLYLDIVQNNHSTSKTYNKDIRCNLNNGYFKSLLMSVTFPISLLILPYDYYYFNNPNNYLNRSLKDIDK